jgi:protoheme ferro-lyase
MEKKNILLVNLGPPEFVNANPVEEYKLARKQ